MTATRVETNLQQTPMSIQAFTGEDLVLGGVDQGRDLGIMVPNVVLNPSFRGERSAEMIIRGLPGVTTYFDGFHAGDWGFLQRSFVELDRVEVLRGPQGTLFGRNTNGGAIQLITRPPAEEFRAMLGVELGELDRRTLRVAVDAPISERWLTKWTAASSENDGFLDSQTAPLTLGDEDGSLFRGDILWRPTDRFSLRFTVNDENRNSSDPRIVRISNTQNPIYIAQNVLAGNPDYLSRARAIDPSFPDPPVALPGDRFTPETHEPGFPGGTLGRWQTRSDTVGPTAIADHRFVTATLDWDINDRWSLESLTSYSDWQSRQMTDYDASEFTLATHGTENDGTGSTQELHLLGNHFDGRLRTLLGVWYTRYDTWDREYSWWFYDFTFPSPGPDIPPPNPAAIGYVQSWGATVGNLGVANIVPPFFFSSDALFHANGSEQAVFGELTIGLLDRLDLTFGFRFTGDDEGAVTRYVPIDAPRPIEPGTTPDGDSRATDAVVFHEEFPDFGTVSTPRISIAYEPTDQIYLYASYAEGFTQGEIANNPNLPEPIPLDPEVVKTREIGLRSDWLGSRLRLNATYFDSRWDGLRVVKLVEIENPNNTGTFVAIPAPSSDGVAASSGFELEIDYLPGERWELDFAVGLLDTEYLDIGDPPPNGSGLQPGIPFAYAPELSYSLGVRYRWPMAGGGELLLAGDYGWMDEYQRASANQFQNKNPDGSDKPEPSYGLLNARIVYESAAANWRLSVFGTNLTDEWYVNGGFNTGVDWGYDIATIGRPREIGLGLDFVFD